MNLFIGNLFSTLECSMYIDPAAEARFKIKWIGAGAVDMIAEMRPAFLCLTVLLLGYAALFGCVTHAQNGSILASKTIWAALAGALASAVVAGRLSRKAQASVLAAIIALVGTEALLQAAGWLGLLPGLNTKEKAPFARVYWTAEGRGNSVRNRFGWHAPEFDVRAPRRIAVIGDSFVEAVEVGRDRTHPVVLQQLLRERAPRCAVFALGTHGTSPAFHLEVLDYAQRHFAPQEVILFLYLGNDISESLPALNHVPPEDYIYYDFNAAGRLELMPASAAHRQRFIHTIEQCHAPLWMNLPVIAKSHCILMQTFLSVRDDIARTRRLRALMKADPAFETLGSIGLNPKTFATPPDPETRHAMKVMLAELALLQQRCAQSQIQLRLVTIPLFPPQFYATQHGVNWTLQLGESDFLGWDREIAAFARSEGLPLLSLADWLAARKADSDEIRSLYFSNGSGHFTERGHRMCARAVFETFYGQDHE